jgi:hypothetical protein
MFDLFFDYVAPVLCLWMGYHVFKIPKETRNLEGGPVPAKRPGDPSNEQLHGEKPPRLKSCS